MPRMFKRATLTVAAAATLALGTPATQASAINQTPCGTHKDFLKIEFDINGWPTPACFANTGSTNIYIPYPLGLTSGNNAGYVEATARDGHTVWVMFDKWKGAELWDYPAITKVTIY